MVGDAGTGDCWYGCHHGDDVIYGTISRLKDDSVYIIAGADQKEMCLARWAIRSVEDAPLENDSEPLV